MSERETMRELLVTIDGSGSAVAQVGGKAAGLDRLAAHRFPIPRTLAITAAAYRRFVAQAGLERWLTQVAARAVPEPGALAAEESEIVDRFLTAPLPDRVERAIDDAARAVLSHGPAVVRSSATAEDMGGASFAGQYRTFVRLGSVDEVIDAVRRCWASLWLPAARSYRQQQAIPDTDLAMAVIVQTMIEAEWSGVAFTTDPGGRHDIMRIEVVPGLGEALVSGAVTPLDFALYRPTLEISPVRGDTPPAFLEELGRMLLRVEDELDAPQDIEWSWADGRLVLLQARPITVHGPTAAFDDGLDRPVGSDDEFTPHGVVEMLPGAISPLLWSINAPMIENGFRSVVATLGGPALDIGRPYLGRFRGRAALNLSSLRAVAGAMPGGSAAAVERQFMGRTMEEPEEEEARASLRSMLRGRKARARLADDVALVCAAADGVVGLDVQLTNLSARRALAYGETVNDLAWRIAAAEVAASSAAAAAYQSVEMVLGRWMDSQLAAQWTQRLSAGALEGELAGTRLQRELRRVWDAQIAGNAELEAVMRDQAPERIAATVEQLGATGEALQETVAGASRMAGSRSMYGAATWSEDQVAVWRFLAMVGNDPTAGGDLRPGEARDELREMLTQGRRWRTVRVLTGQFVDLRMRWVDSLVSEATANLRMRERAKSALLTLGGEQRRLIVELARRLVASHHIDDPDDIELYTDLEVRRMIAGGAPPPPSVVHWRRTVKRRCLAEGPLPDRFTGSPDGRQLLDVDRSETLPGWAASPGRTSRRARVVSGLGDAGSLESGEILVAEATDPSWTPLLSRAAGLVLETGGPLSHGAIVARELGIPAVLSVNRATSIIADGDIIEVDGYAGVVRRSAHKSQEAA